MSLTEKQQYFLDTAKSAFSAGNAKLLVFSKPHGDGPAKVRITRKKDGSKILFVTEKYLKDGRVTQKNTESFPLDTAVILFEEYEQSDLCTENGDAIYKKSRKGKELVSVPSSLRSALSKNTATAARISDLNKEKNRMLTGKEPFLYELGISDKNGEVLPSRQAKFRQICRFLEFVKDICHTLPEEGEIRIYDLCCGKCYLSFAVYHYFSNILNRNTSMLCADLKGDVLKACESTAKKLGFTGMHFLCEDIRKLSSEIVPHLVLSLHACDTATDIVLETAVRLKAKAILSTPCCHRALSKSIDCKPLEFATRYGILSDKLCSALTDGLRTLYLEKSGYTVTAAELIDPDDTPKNVMIRATLGISEASRKAAEENYEKTKAFLGI